MGLKKLLKSLMSNDMWRFLQRGRRYTVDFSTNWEKWKKEAPVLGMRAAASIHLGGFMPERYAHGSLRCLRLKGYRFPFYYRQSTSDLEVVYQVFANKEYETITDDKNVRFIVDCGANI